MSGPPDGLPPTSGFAFHQHNQKPHPYQQQQYSNQTSQWVSTCTAPTLNTPYPYVSYPRQLEHGYASLQNSYTHQQYHPAWYSGDSIRPPVMSPSPSIYMDNYPPTRFRYTSLPYQEIRPPLETLPSSQGSAQTSDVQICWTPSHGTHLAGGYHGSTKNLIKNPSFIALQWNGDVGSQIDHRPWTIESNNGGYLLEKKPIGATHDKYPAELDGFAVWCVATSSSMSQRCQLIDLIQEGFSVDFLDGERPPINIYEWFTSRTDCAGQYFLNVSLLDQQKRQISGFSFDTGIKTAPSGYWFKEEYTFPRSPAGVRYIMFKDGGKDCKNWAGFYGAKMVGAFAGVMTNRSVNAGGIPHMPSYSKPLPRNLLENANLKPQSGWQGNHTDHVEFSSWKIIANDGDGIQLEKEANGTAAGSYPREVGSDPHCIATSYEWFKRVQIIDLAKNAIVPHMLDNPDLKIYVCEWFASRTDNEGMYFLNASLLDENKREIPGCCFESKENKALSDEWEKVEYTFYPVPDEARFLRFEDGGKDSKYWAGRYGVKMTGASVYSGRKHDHDYNLECNLM